MTNSRRALAALLTLLLTALTLAVLTTSPATAAGAPTARNDRTSVESGGEVVVNVLANDTVARKRTATVTVKPSTIGVSAVARGRKVVIAAGDSTSAGTFKVRYTVTDKRGRSDSALVRVRVTGAPAGTLRALVEALPVVDERRSGYDRDLFRHWVDADGDSCDTRSEVLLAETVSPFPMPTDCPITTANAGGGQWFSYYDGVSTSEPSGFDIDHVVALAEAWDSGAHAWDATRREAFANDLDDPRALVAVTASSNRSKSDQDPAEWLPPVTSVHCRYVEEWVAVKTRWSLTVDFTEKAVLTRLAGDCPDTQVEVVVVD